VRLWPNLRYYTISYQKKLENISQISVKIGDLVPKLVLGTTRTRSRISSRTTETFVGTRLVECSLLQSKCIYDSYFFGSQDSVVCIGTGYGLDDRGVGVGVLVRSRIFSSQHRPDLLWGPPSFLYNEYRGLFPRG
jgi:hypothetical protein